MHAPEIRGQLCRSGAQHWLWYHGAGSEIIVYVPDTVPLSARDVFEVVVGQHGYYLDSLVEGQ